MLPFGSYTQLYLCMCFNDKNFQYFQLYGGLMVKRLRLCSKVICSIPLPSFFY